MSGPLHLRRPLPQTSPDTGEEALPTDGSRPAYAPDAAPPQLLLAPDEEEPCPWSPQDSAGCAEFDPEDCDHRCRKAGA